MTTQIDTTPSQSETEELCDALRSCRSDKGFIDASGTLSALIKRYVQDKRFDLLEKTFEVSAEASDPDEMSETLELIDYHLTTRDIPASEGYPARQATLMAIPFRMLPRPVGSLLTCVTARNLALSHEDVASITGELVECWLADQGARFVVSRQLISQQTLTNMTMEEVDALTLEMLTNYLGVRDDWRRKSEGGCNEVSCTAGSQDEGKANVAEEQLQLETVGELVGMSYLVFLYIDEPGFSPFQWTELPAEDRLAHLREFKAWEKHVEAIVESRFGNRVVCNIPYMPSPFYMAHARAKRLSVIALLRDLTVSQLSLVGVDVQDVEVELAIEEDSADSEPFDVGVTLRRKDSGKQLGWFSARLLCSDLGQSFELAKRVFEELGISSIVTPALV